MKLSQLMKSLNQVRIPIEAVALCLVILTSGSTASANPSWSREPSWASSSQPAAAARKATLSRDDRYPVSPFSPGSQNIALDVGQVFLMGDLSSQYSDNIGSRLHYTYGVSEIFAFDASVGYSEHSDGKFSMATLLTGLRTNLSWYDRVIPYVTFGLGFYKPSYNEYTTTTGNSSAKLSAASGTSISPLLFGIHLGPGIDLEITDQLFFGAALTFHDVFGTQKNTPIGPLDVGGTFTSFLIHAGVTF